MKLKIWFQETRPQFLLLSVALLFLGTGVAWYEGVFHLGYALLALAGLLLAHIAVNVLNDYFDFRSKLDFKTKRTPFSGGSGILPAGLLKPGHVFWFGVISFLLAAAIGIYFIVERGLGLLPLLLAGALFIFLYTPLITKLGWSEWAAGAGMGSLPILGAYFIQTASYTMPAVIACIPSGILVHNLLLLNEFPDMEADSKVGRKTLPISMGGKKASWVYSVLMVVIYFWVIAWVVAGVMPLFSLLVLLTLPLAVKAIEGALNYQDMNRLMPAMANNVMVVLFFQVLLGAGYILGRVFLG